MSKLGHENDRVISFLLAKLGLFGFVLFLLFHL